jgi:hypothetical protein
MRPIPLTSLAVLTAVSSQTVSAQRAETILPARAIVRDECPVTPSKLIAKEFMPEQESGLAGALASIGASIVSDLVKAGVTGLANALEAASQEHGYVAEATTDFDFYRLNPPKALADGDLPTLSTGRTCLVLYVPASTDDSSVFATAADLKALSDRKAGNPLYTFANGPEGDLLPPADRIAKLVEIGLDKAPALYVEAELLARPDGMIVRPVLAWYREKLKGAPLASSGVELQATFAVPGGTDKSDIGDIFAVARIKLPTMSPLKLKKGGQPSYPSDSLKGADELASFSSPVILQRPTAGSPNDTVTAYSAAYTSFATLKADVRAKERAATSKERKLKAAIGELDAENKKPKPDPAKVKKLQQQVDELNNEAEIVAASDARADLKVAGNKRDGLKYTGKDGARLSVGSTNVKLRFVVIKDANKFGLALAAALKGQAEATGTAVKNQLTTTPEPDWSTEKTAYLEAVSQLNAKQREYDAAVTAGNAADISRFADEVQVQKGRVNEAALAAHLPMPYKGLLAQAAR